jgi:hypothetical protein
VDNVGIFTFFTLLIFQCLSNLFAEVKRQKTLSPLFTEVAIFKIGCAVLLHVARRRNEVVSENELAPKRLDTSWQAGNTVWV